MASRHSRGCSSTFVDAPLKCAVLASLSHGTSHRSPYAIRATPYLLVCRLAYGPTAGCASSRAALTVRADRRTPTSTCPSLSLLRHTENSSLHIHRILYSQIATKARRKLGRAVPRWSLVIWASSFRSPVHVTYPTRARVHSTGGTSRR